MLAPCTLVIVNESPFISVSLPRRLVVDIVVAVSSLVAKATSLAATGGLLMGTTAFTAIFTVAVELPPNPSLMVYVKLAGPV